jgi:hypothetical protein
VLLDISIDNYRLILGSVYGPNRDDLEFFDNLKLDIRNLNQKSIILGGDWNATLDSNPVPVNIDVINMVSIPSKRRSQKIAAIASSLNLVDPYRFFNPEKRDFTFIPNILNNRNRSRLDFFLISDNLIKDCKNSTIPHALSSKLLDHKQISMCFKSSKKIHPQKINDVILKDPTIEPILLIHAFDTYLNHARIVEGFSQEDKNSLSARIGQLMLKIERIQELKTLGAQNGTFLETAVAVNALLDDLNADIDRLPSLEFFEGLELECPLDVFFETFAIVLKNATLSFQSNFFKSKNLQKNKIRTEIKDLKENYSANCDLIFEKERQLSNIVEIELKEELALVKNFERLNDERITPYFLQLAKTPVKSDSLDTLCKDDSAPFDS